MADHTMYPAAEYLSGYTITPTSYGYLLTGKRGAVYGLYRYVRVPDVLYAIKATGAPFALPSIRRHVKFTDRNGVLEVMS